MTLRLGSTVSYTTAMAVKSFCHTFNVSSYLWKQKQTDLHKKQLALMILMELCLLYVTEDIIAQAEINVRH